MEVNCPYCGVSEHKFPSREYDVCLAKASGWTDISYETIFTSPDDWYGFQPHSRSEREPVPRITESYDEWLKWVLPCIPDIAYLDWSTIPPKTVRHEFGGFNWSFFGKGGSQLEAACHASFQYLTREKKK